MFTRIVSIAFWITIGLFFLNFHFAYQSLIIGITALIIGVIQIIGTGPGRPTWW
jgi:hypothetical protein